MKYSIISDIHVKNAGDSSEKLLLTFLQSKEVQSSDAIILLGDIFDLMIGPHSQYYSRFHAYFNQLKILLEKKIKVYYVEGNHDFHLNLLYENFFKINKHLSPHFFKLSNGFTLTDNQKKIYFTHGDDLELNNPGQKIFKAIVTSKPLSFFANYLLPYFVITSIGESSSKISRNRNEIRYSKDLDVTEIKQNFRMSAEQFIKNNPYDIIVMGHSHVQDNYTSENNFQYINNGYAQNSKTYISIEDGNISFKQLET